MGARWLSGALYRGKPLIATSWMGLDIRDQEPCPYLGENPGFITSETASNDRGHYASLVAHYMQNGSLLAAGSTSRFAPMRMGSRSATSCRAAPLHSEEILIRDEATQFNFAQPGALSHLDTKPDFDLPFFLEQPGIGWIAIAAAGPELSSGKYPRTYLVRSGDGMLTNLARSAKEPTVAYVGTTPLIWPWRVIMAGPDKRQLLNSETLLDLNR